ncbi:MAG: 50S ribosomal protein L15 [bacterium]
MEVTLKLNPRPAAGAIKNNKRVGRGIGSGHGKTSTRGSNGAGSRSGNKRKLGFEGGQMPLSRRLPKFGFKAPFRVEYEEVNVSRLEEAAKSGRLPKGEPITPALLRAVGMITGGHARVKVLGVGDVTVAMTIQVHKVSKGAAAKIEKAGGKIEAVVA